MPTYPDYVYQTLARARDIGQWYCGQSDATVLCFDVLALFDCAKALAGSEEIQSTDLVEALQYRPKIMMG